MVEASRPQPKAARRLQTMLDAPDALKLAAADARTVVKPAAAVRLGANHPVAVALKLAAAVKLADNVLVAVALKLVAAAPRPRARIARVPSPKKATPV
jgi:hypothetical protein